MYRKPHTVFMHDGALLGVFDVKDDTRCAHCYYISEDYDYDCTKLYEIRGSCNCTARSNSTSVYFKKLR